MIGQQIQNYVIISQLGQGGMGTVYKAVDNVLGREVAMKMLNTLMINQPQVLERFKKEAQVLARLLHPNIAVIYNLIEQNDQYFMVMEYVEGQNLDEVLRRNRTIPYQMVALIFMQALEGLHHAHRKGIYHRDIKPSNLILTPDGTVKLMDFGIAKVAGEQRMTQVNRVIGTVEFLAPEIIEGKEPSVASDIYAAGVTMYELLSGKLPFESNTDYSLMQEILKKKPVAPDKINAAVPKALSNIVMKALEKRPENRFADAGAFHDALAVALPELRGASLAILSKRLETASVPPPTQIISQQEWRNVNDGSIQATRMETITRPNNLLQTVSQKYLPTNRSRIIAGAVLLLLFLFLGYSIFSKNETAGKQDGQTGEVKHEEKNPTSDNDKKSTDQSNSGGTVVPPAPVTTDPVNPQPVNDDNAKREQDRIDKEKKDKAKRDQEKKDQEQRDMAKREQDRIDQEKKDQEQRDREGKEQQKKDVTINTDDLTIYLHLQTDLQGLSMKDMHKDIPVSFSVTRPVQYGGVTIIREGTIVSGEIRVGSSRSDVKVSSVVGINGQRIPIYTNREQMYGPGYKPITKSKGHNYSATVKRGTRINF